MAADVGARPHCKRVHCCILGARSCLTDAAIYHQLYQSPSASGGAGRASYSCPLCKEMALG